MKAAIYVLWSEIWMVQKHIASIYIYREIERGGRGSEEGEDMKEVICGGGHVMAHGWW